MRAGSLTLFEFKLVADLECEQLQVHRLLERHDASDASQTVWKLLADESRGPGDIS